MISEMLKGVCNSGQYNVLVKGATYYLFPAGPFHFYVSKFPNKNAHRGCFNKDIFDILEESTSDLEQKELIEEVELAADEFGQLSLF